jgi:hypothetical protein
MSRDLDALSDDALIFGPEVADLLAISLATFHVRRRWRMFPIREVMPRLDRRPRWRLGDVRAYVRGTYVRTVARPAARTNPEELRP